MSVFPEESGHVQLTSHTLQRVAGPNRGRQRFEVQQPQQARIAAREHQQAGNPGQPRPRPNFRPQAAKAPAKPKAFSHDDLLQAARGTTIVFWRMDGSKVSAELINADRYALVIKTEAGASIVFKHDIADIVLPQAS